MFVIRDVSLLVSITKNNYDIFFDENWSTTQKINGKMRNDKEVQLSDKLGIKLKL